MKKIHVFRVFYRDYANDVSISSAAPESLLADRIAPLAERLLVNDDNFLGVLDDDELVLQCYRDGDQMVLELLFPESPGYLQKRVGVAEALALLASLPAHFDEGLLPGAHYVG